MDRIACPLLYSYDSKGRIKQWQIGAMEEADGTATMLTKAGLKNGKLKTTKRVVKEGKNIGRSNETTPYEQAVSEAKSKHQKKVDKGYVTDISYYHVQNFPMKAATYRDPDGKKSMEHHIIWPAHATPKLNGLCVIGEPDHLWSKTRKLDYSKACKHLIPDMNNLLGMDKIPFHGELYKHGWTLEEINRCGKKYRPGRSEQLELHVYDLVDPSSPSHKRDDELDTIFLNHVNSDCKIIRVPYTVVRNHDEFQAFHDKCVADGYEGACIRNMQGPYELDTRSLHLQKYKDGWQDAEFTITGGKAELQYTGEDNEIEHKCVVYECCRKDRPDVKFECRPKGSTEARAKMYKNLTNDIGKDLKVRFFSYMESGAPEFPVGLMIRDPE